MPAIEVTHVSKAYKHYASLKGQLAEWLLGGLKKTHTLNWILSDIHFSVNPGEAVGIVGMNGAGKSTLLKIITGTSYPTIGSVTTHGRVCALLELGVGFHPDCTGRQNAVTIGQLMGYSTADIRRFLPTIEAFAEIGPYIDRAIRVYSSGMKMRLAFAIATTMTPDVMIVDEALAVGDGYFQHKCFKRIRELLAQGTALLFVSHDNAAVTALCDRALLLHQGKIAMQGNPEAVMNYYKALLADFEAKQIQHQVQPNGRFQTISGTKEASILEVKLLNNNQEIVETIHVGDMVTLRILVLAAIELSDLTIGYEIKDVFGQPIFGTNTYHLNHHLTDIANQEILECRFRFAANVGVGDYSISVALHSSYDHLEKNYEWRDLALTFQVTNLDKPSFLGTSWLPPQLECIRQ